ncbi:hypothetical protein MATL_G00225760 [Megalops atlanticus]|uniref:Uncharacterized protein n=1 Tax=Megalops atlanticus TaxID=7932 RepID=A0A9D3PHY9_MEGAT|nr:hypothetical protein MATL_G00225760 [Megalops atlanticus]
MQMKTVCPPSGSEGLKARSAEGRSGLDQSEARNPVQVRSSPCLLRAALNDSQTEKEKTQDLQSQKTLPLLDLVQLDNQKPFQNSN